MEPTFISFLGSLGCHKMYELNSRCFLVVLESIGGDVMDLSAYSHRIDALKTIAQFAARIPDELT